MFMFPIRRQPQVVMVVITAAKEEDKVSGIKSGKGAVSGVKPNVISWLFLTWHQLSVIFTQTAIFS